MASNYATAARLATPQDAVMAGLAPAIHGFCCGRASKTWMPGIKPGMTS